MEHKQRTIEGGEMDQSEAAGVPMSPNFHSQTENNAGN